MNINDINADNMRKLANNVYIEHILDIIHRHALRGDYEVTFALNNTHNILSVIEALMSRGFTIHKIHTDIIIKWG